MVCLRHFTTARVAGQRTVHWGSGIPRIIDKVKDAGLRRTREILVKMVENGWLRKEGASRSTIYVKNTEKK